MRVFLQNRDKLGMQIMAFITALIVASTLLLCTSGDENVEALFKPMETNVDNSGMGIPGLNVNHPDDLLFGNVAREYVFGGYIERVDPYSDKAKMLYRHVGCGPGYYSAQPRLNNPPKDDAQTSYAKFLVLTESGTEKRRPLANCAFIGMNIGCCKRFKGLVQEVANVACTIGTFGSGDCEFHGYRCKYKYNCEEKDHYCGIPKTITQSLRETASLQNSLFIGVTTGYVESLNPSIGKTFGSNDFYAEDIRYLPQWGGTKVLGKLNWGSAKGTALNAHWGPSLPPRIQPETRRPYDLAWNKEMQCRSCRRFGDLYYSMATANSLCFKVGPGRVASQDATSEYADKTSMFEYDHVSSPSFMITVRWPKGADPDKITATAYSQQASTVFQSCSFDSTPMHTIGSSEVKEARKCKSLKDNIQIPVPWPEECDAPESCFVFAAITGVASGDASASFSTEFGDMRTGVWDDNTRMLGDTRLFAHVDLPADPSSFTVPPGDFIDPVTTRAVRYRVYTTLLDVKRLYARNGMAFKYELFTARKSRATSMAGCSAHINQFDLPSAQNSYTYYYPYQSNYFLANSNEAGLADTYHTMASEQMAAMEYFRKTTDSPPDNGFPFMSTNRQMNGNNPFAFTSVCADAHNKSTCNSRLDGGVQGYRFEALPSQKASKSSTQFTPWFPESRYFGDYPNYSEDDVVYGWDKQGTALDAWYRSDDGRHAYDVFKVQMRVFRAAAMCRLCTAGYEGNRARVDNGRYVRAVLGPKGQALAIASPAKLPIMDSDYNRVCQPCPAGTFNDRAGRNCQSCEAGRFSTSNSRAGRIPAFYTTQAPRRCWDCLVGYFCEQLDFMKITTVDDVAKYGNMRPCPLGTYQDKRGATSCNICPGATTTTQVGSTKKSDCLRGAVPAGYRFKGPYTERIAALQQLLPDGVTANMPPNLDLVECDKGMYSSVSRLFSNSSVSCTPCGIGRYSDRIATISCAICPPGKYSDTNGVTTCTTCGSSTKRNYVVGTSATTCKLCGRYEYAPSVFAAECAKCPPCTERDDSVSGPSAAPGGCKMIEYSIARSGNNPSLTGLESCVNATSMETVLGHSDFRDLDLSLRRQYIALALSEADTYATSPPLKREATFTAICTVATFVLWAFFGLVMAQMETNVCDKERDTLKDADNAAWDRTSATLGACQDWERVNLLQKRSPAPKARKNNNRNVKV